MPTIRTIGPYRFFFYADEGKEPPHVHVERENKKAKFWLTTIRLEKSGGFSPTGINRIQKLIEENREQFLRRWNEFFTP